LHYANLLVFHNLLIFLQLSMFVTIFFGSNKLIIIISHSFTATTKKHIPFILSLHCQNLFSNSLPHRPLFNRFFYFPSQQTYISSRQSPPTLLINIYQPISNLLVLIRIGSHSSDARHTLVELVLLAWPRCWCTGVPCWLGCWFSRTSC